MRKTPPVVLQLELAFARYFHVVFFIHAGMLNGGD